MLAKAKQCKVQYQEISWSILIFISLLYITAIAGTILLFFFSKIPIETWLLALVFYIFTGLSITAGYHRLFSHRSYQTKKIIEILFLFFGAAAFEQSALIWSETHRRHHCYIDTPDDPYNIHAGFLYAHFFWLFFKKNTINDYAEFAHAKDLLRNKLVMLQHKHYLPIAITAGLLLPALIATLWGDPLGGFIIAGALRIFLVQQATYCVNSVAHLWGKKTYNAERSPRDNHFVSLITFGEGYHSYHHEFPFDYRNGVRLHHWDPTKWLIKSLAWVKLATGLRQASREQILLKKAKP